MKEKTKSNPLLRISIFAVIVVIVIMIMAGFVSINQKKSEISKLSDEIKVQKNTNAEIDDTLKSDDKDLIEKYARDKLGYGSDGEQVYIDISGH